MRKGERNESTYHERGAGVLGVVGPPRSPADGGAGLWLMGNDLSEIRKHCNESTVASLPGDAQKKLGFVSGFVYERNMTDM